MSGSKDTTAALAAFEGQYGETVSTALGTYADYMRKAAGEAQGAWEAIKDDPEKVARQDKSLITTHGLQMMNEAFSQSADKAERALREWESLRERLAENEDGT